jgi:triosephosphate isomerase
MNLNMRARIVAGNWKMNTTPEEGKKLVSEMIPMLSAELTGKVHTILIPPSLHLTGLISLFKNRPMNLSWGAQDCSTHTKGAFTGEISAAMLQSIGVSYILVGHSERRAYHNETSTSCREKILRVLEAGGCPIYCVGETLQEREAGQVTQIIEQQLSEGLPERLWEESLPFVIAYEPVWAIGTGKTATPQQASEVHGLIRQWLKIHSSEQTATTTSILYGGSVKADNATELFNMPDVDGGLIGGASLESRSFVDIVKACAR